MASDRIFLGYDVVDNSHFREGAAKARSGAASERARLGLPPKYFLCVCRFEEKKNLGTVVRSYARYRLRSKRPWSLVIVGDGLLRPEIEAETAQLGLCGSVLFPGAISYEAIPAYYGLAGCFVHASTTEQWGLVVNEAMAAGLPLLVSERCGCAPELVRSGENGYLFNPGDPDGLAELMVRISENSERAAQFAGAGEAIIAQWGPERFGEGLAAAVRVAQHERRHAPAGLDRFLVRSLARLQ
jgi:glycosyltransferase involved in cell wall biosynthesis